MVKEKVLTLNLKRRVKLAGDTWEERIEKITREVSKVAILLCDVWDNHWCGERKEEWIC